MSGAFSESVVESAAIAWLEAVGWKSAHGTDITPEMPAADRADFDEIRDSLLPKLISGKIRVRDAERLIGKTA